MSEVITTSVKFVLKNAEDSVSTSSASTGDSFLMIAAIIVAIALAIASFLLIKKKCCSTRACHSATHTYIFTNCFKEDKKSLFIIVACCLVAISCFVALFVTGNKAYAEQQNALKMDNIVGTVDPDTNSIEFSSTQLQNTSSKDFYISSTALLKPENINDKDCVWNLTSHDKLLYNGPSCKVATPQKPSETTLIKANNSAVINLSQTGLTYDTAYELVGKDVLTISFEAAKSSEVYVATDGNDSNEGTIEHPVKSLVVAKELAKYKEGATNVNFREGSYTIDSTVKFDSDDKNNVTYKAYNNEKVSFTSGKPYTGFEECQINGTRMFKKDVGTGANFNILFNETTTLSRTRYPDTGYIHVKSVDPADMMPDKSGEECHQHWIGFYVDTAEMQSFKNINDVVVRVLHYWKDEMMNIKSYDPTTGHVVLSKYTSMNVRVGDRLFLENVYEQMKQPQQWYLDKNEGTLYYVPTDTEKAETLTLWGSETETMIDINGVDAINFENINFRCNGFNIHEGIDFSQAAYDATPCLSYNYSNNSNINNCEFHDLAGGAVFLGVGVKDAFVQNCLFENIGAQAVYIRGENVALTDPKVTKNINVKNNIVSGFGKVFYNAVGVLAIHANSVNILNNEIHDGYYTAISVGWIWGYAYNVTYNNKICDNLIYNIGQGWLSDMGGIYTLGIQEGTVVSGNVIHNVAADPEQGGYGGWGIYLDEGSSKILVENNLSYACGSDAYHLHYGTHNTVRNNIFAMSAESQIRINSNFDRVQPLEEGGDKITAYFSNNILLSEGGVLSYSYGKNKGAFSDSKNLFWDLTNKTGLYFGKDSVASQDGITIQQAITEGYLHDSVIKNPMFKNAKQFDFSFSDTSVISTIGFKTWDYQNAGTLKGTTIGRGTQGGLTAYNANSKEIIYKPFTPKEK